MRSIVLGAMALALAAAPEAASAAVLYDNGALDGRDAGWSIHGTYFVSDSFTLARAAIVTEVDFGVWTPANDPITGVDWAIWPSQGASGSAQVSSVLQFVNDAGLDISWCSFSTGAVTLPAGTYDLVLQKAGTAYGSLESHFWDP